MKGAFSFRLILVIHSLFMFFPLCDIVHSIRYLFVIYISFQKLITLMSIQVFKSTGVEELMFLVSQLKTKLHPQVNPICNYNSITSSFNFLSLSSTICYINLFDNRLDILFKNSESLSNSLLGAYRR